MTEQFSLKLDSSIIDQLVTAFPSATGRDIKGLIKLVAKFCQHMQMAPEIDVFKRCSVFRGMDMANA